ncbi:MAG TPA: flagellar basal body P-ring formation protein FlgA [Rhodobacteraceae bacterium]|nr:flagellar basal body P-ring formation protein FlgA [Paracoccaceae bacterium]
MNAALRIAVLLMLAAWPARADIVVAAHTLKSRALIQRSDLELREGDAGGAFTRIEDVIGLEARVVLYQGRPIARRDVGAPSIIERNQLVTLIYRRGGLAISAEARSLGRAGVGERLRVMNTASRKTVTGTVTPNGDVIVGTTPNPFSN